MLSIGILATHCFTYLPTYCASNCIYVVQRLAWGQVNRKFDFNLNEEMFIYIARDNYFGFISPNCNQSGNTLSACLCRVPHRPLLGDLHGPEGETASWCGSERRWCVCIVTVNLCSQRHRQIPVSPFRYKMSMVKQSWNFWIPRAWVSCLKSHSATDLVVYSPNSTFRLNNLKLHTWNVEKQKVVLCSSKKEANNNTWQQK